MTVARRLGSRPLEGLVAPLLLLLAVTLPALLAAREALLVPTFHLDGAYQTFGGLARFNSGQVAGRDFLPYLGIGPIVLLWPAFIIAGSSVAASVFAAAFVTLIGLQVGFGVLLYLACRPKRNVLVLAAATLPTIAILAPIVWPEHAELVRSIPGFQDLSDQSIPGNSLRPIRSLAPYILVVVALGAFRTSPPTVARIAGMGLVIGLVGFVWSSDYSFTSALLLLVLVTAWGLHPKRWPVSRHLLLWGSSLVGFCVLGLVATAGHLLEYLTYSFIDVRGDQSWYFGPWGPGTRVRGVDDFGEALTGGQLLLPLALLTALSVFALVKRDWERALAAYIGGALFVGGTVAIIGGHVGSYYYTPFRLWALLTTLLAGVWLAGALGSWGMRRVGRSKVMPAQDVRARNGDWPSRVLIISVALVTISSVVVATSLLLSERSALSRSPRHAFDARLGGFIDLAYRPHLELARHVEDGQVIEEYAGLLSALTGPSTTLRVDSVIHALGRERGRFEDAIAQGPEYVITTAPDFSIWATWSVSANWWFYRHLFRSYVPEQSSPATLVWSKSPASSWGSVDCRVDSQAQEVIVSADGQGVFEVVLRYSAAGPGASTFAMVQNNMNLAADAAGFLALDPAASLQRFPVYAASAGPARLRIAGQPIRMAGCTAAKVEPPRGADTMALYLPLFEPSSTPIDRTDAWVARGVHRKVAGFLVRNFPQNVDAFSKASAVQFGDRDTRAITGLQVLGGDILVFLEGEPLDPDLAGYPHHFTILDGLLDTGR